MEEYLEEKLKKSALKEYELPKNKEVLKTLLLNLNYSSSKVNISWKVANNIYNVYIMLK